jgi:ketosteroid isomerase-like protein
MFTRDATSFPPGAEPAHGPAALHALTVDYLKSGVTAFTERTTSLYGDADLLIDQGEYVVTYGPDHTVERGKYLNVWKPEDGTWKIHANIWNTSPANASP